MAHVVSFTFTLENYCCLLTEFLNAGYRFLSFSQALKVSPDDHPFVVLRHDVDMDLDKALEMAKIDAELGIAATYFLLLCTDQYNFFSQENTEKILRVLELGNDLGLHFDPAAYPEDIQEARFREVCLNEANIMKHWFKKPVKAISFHRPNAFVLEGKASITDPLPHTCMDEFTKDIKYFSDSRGFWREGWPTTCEAFLKRQSIQLCVHPIWWQPHPKSPYDVLVDFVDRMRERREVSVAKNCTVFRVGRLADEFGDVR